MVPSVRIPHPPRLLLAALTAASLAACGTVTGADPTVAAKVGDTTIPVTEVEERYAQAKRSPQVGQQLENDSDGSFKAQVQAQIVSSLVLDEIVSQWAEELGVEVTDADVDAEREAIIEQVGGQEAFDEAVEQAGLTPEEVDEQLRLRALQTKVAEAVAGGDDVSDAEVEAFYEENREGRFGEQAQARHILVDERAEAVDIKRRLEGGADFARLAERRSTDTGSAQQGGDLGSFGRGQMAGPFERAVFGAQVGDVVGPVKTEFGFHVIEVTGRTPARSLEEASGEIRAELGEQSRGERLQEALRQRLRQAEVTVNPRFGTWDPQAGEVRPGDPLGETREATEPPSAGGGATEPATESPLEQATE